MASLSDLVSSRITPEVMQKLAGLAGISPTDTKRALDAIVPTQFDGLASMGANVLRGERQTIERDIPAEPVERLDRRPALETSRVVEPPRPAPKPVRSNTWLWLLLPLLALAALGLWYANRPASTTTSLVGTRWHWARTLLRDGSERRPGNATAYMLDFQRDGNLAVQADCNTGKGKYTPDGAAFTLGTLTSTQTVCPGTSLSEVFLQQLQSSGQCTSGTASSSLP